VNRRSFLATAVLAGLLPAAGRPQDRRVVVDATGRRVEIPERVERVYAAGPPASILVFAVAPDKLIGWTSTWREAERPFVARRYADLPTLGRLTGRGNTANVEVVLRAKPDVIIDYGAVNATFASLAQRVQQQTGIPYLLLDGDFDRMAEAAAQLGTVTGEEARAQEWVAYIRDTLALIDARLARVPRERRPRVYYGRGPLGLVTGRAGSINVESIERLGAINVAAAMGRGGLAQVSVEQVLLWNPDIVLTIDPNFYAAARVHPLWRALPAIEAGRIHLAPNVPFGWIDFPPSINRLIGLRWLARILYPEVFPDDLRPIVRDFYSRCYHQTPTEAQLDQLLRASVPPA
jgi:iron complex transport system substrate-binding protein